ncbi:MAG: acyl-CoA transferase [Proteobacteria bacterium ST_bin13]|nr:MAG: acyl-CoA transferase [Proteobacteria bacterium ST_bin13]
MTDLIADTILKDILVALNLPAALANRVTFGGDDRLPSCFPVSDLAAASIGAACAAVATLAAAGGQLANISVHYRLASLWFGWSIHPEGWAMPSPWDAIAGDYLACDGWIKLHTNAPHHRAAALSALACEPTRDAVAAAVAARHADAIEAAVIAAGGCAARLMPRAEWAAHPQGQAVANEPIILWDDAASGERRGWQPLPDRPLAGIRVLDLTRVLAGPVATRFLAGFGAEVLRIDPPDWDEPGVIPEVSLGKRCARLDLRMPADRDTFTRLLAGADILVHGYRADALDRLGLGAAARQAIRPGLIDVSLNAYGHGGPWANRRGFDSLVQFSSGIAAEGMTWRGANAPVSLPVQALDHATGYLIAAAAIRGVIARLAGEGLTCARLSLARTATLLSDHRTRPDDGPFVQAQESDYANAIERTDWGPARRLRPPAAVNGIPMQWDRPAARLGSSAANWD